MGSAFGFTMPDWGVKRGNEFTGYLQSRNTPETRSGYSVCSTRPSNREGFKDSFGGLRAVLIFFSLARPPPPRLVPPGFYFIFEGIMSAHSSAAGSGFENRAFWLAPAGGSAGCRNTRLPAGFGKGTALPVAACDLARKPLRKTAARSVSQAYRNSLQISRLQALTFDLCGFRLHHRSEAMNPGSNLNRS